MWSQDGESSFGVLVVDVALTQNAGGLAFAGLSAPVTHGAVGNAILFHAKAWQCATPSGKASVNAIRIQFYYGEAGAPTRILTDEGVTVQPPRRQSDTGRLVFAASGAVSDAAAPDASGTPDAAGSLCVCVATHTNARTDAAAAEAAATSAATPDPVVDVTDPAPDAAGCVRVCVVTHTTAHEAEAVSAASAATGVPTTDPAPDAAACVRVCLTTPRTEADAPVTAAVTGAAAPPPPITITDMGVPTTDAAGAAPFGDSDDSAAVLRQLAAVAPDSDESPALDLFPDGYAWTLEEFNEIMLRMIDSQINEIVEAAATNIRLRRAVVQAVPLSVQPLVAASPLALPAADITTRKKGSFHQRWHVNVVTGVGNVATQDLNLPELEAPTMLHALDDAYQDDTDFRVHSQYPEAEASVMRNALVVIARAAQFEEARQMGCEEGFTGHALSCMHV